MVLATLADLAEHGLASMVDALPMPVGPAPQLLSAQQVAAIAAVTAAATPGPWWTESLTEHDGSTSIGVDAGGDNWIVPCQDLDLADAEFIAHARTDVVALLADNALLRARVAGLLEERHSTNESVDDAAKALRADRDRIDGLESTNTALRARLAVLEAQRAALAERLRAGQTWERGRLVSEDLVSQSELREVFGIPLAAPLDGITRLVAPVQALREDTVQGEHYPAVHHGYLVPRDLPAPDGAR
jgi:hypothetical protein